MRNRRFVILVLATGTQPPEHDLCLIDNESVTVTRAQTRGLPGIAIQIHDTAALTTYQVMMIITGTTLKPCRMTGRLDLTHKFHINTGR